MNPVQLGTPFNTVRRNGSQRNASNGSTDRINALKRGSVRGMHSLLAPGPYGNGGDGRASPTPSWATSINEVSMRPSRIHLILTFQCQSYIAPHMTGPSLGFASNLSHTVIKEQEDEGASEASDVSDSTVDEFDDDELALLGAPWAKEGTLQRKPYWDAPSKRAKEKNWKQEFVVIQKGDLHMFTFGGELVWQARGRGGRGRELDGERK